MRLNLQSTLLVRCLTIGEPNEKENTDPEREHKSTAPQWEETRTAFCRWKGGTTPRYKKAFNRVASKLNTLLKTLHATPHQLPDTRNFSITIESTSVHPCKNPRQHSKMDTYLEMLMPRAKHVSKKHDALFLIDPFVWPRKHTHRKKNVSEISDTREKMTIITTTTHSEKTTCKIAHDAVSLYLPPINVPNQKQPKNERHRNIRKTIRKHKPNRNHRSKQQNLTTTPPAIDLHTPQHKRLKQVGSLRCVIWRSCPPSEIND